MKRDAIPLIGSGLYPLSQAARLIGEDVRKVRRWLKGYSWKYKDGRSGSGPLWPTQFEDADLALDEKVIGFRDLLELRMVAAFVRHGVDLRVIRATIEAAEKLCGEYPLSKRRFLTDGKRIFLQAVEAATGEHKLMDVRGRQFVFTEVIKPSLFAGIEYDRQGDARRWYPVDRRRTIVLDPEIQFGAPIIAEAGIPTDTVHAAYLAEGEDRDRVARLYRIKPAMVSAAVDFEQRLAA